MGNFGSLRKCVCVNRAVCEFVYGSVSVRTRHDPLFSHLHQQVLVLSCTSGGCWFNYAWLNNVLAGMTSVVSNSAALTVLKVQMPILFGFVFSSSFNLISSLHFSLKSINYQNRVILEVYFFK